MTTCPDCAQTMLDVKGCTINTVVLNGRRYDRKPYGTETEDVDIEEIPERCHDCNASLDHVHHYHCDVERCPRCGTQLLSCDCIRPTDEPRRSHQPRPRHRRPA